MSPMTLKTSMFNISLKTANSGNLSSISMTKDIYFLSVLVEKVAG